MSSCRGRARLSGSDMDLEDTITLKELHELTRVEEESITPPVSQPTTSSSHFPDMRPELEHSSQISRSSHQQIQEKVTIFKDEVRADQTKDKSGKPHRSRAGRKNKKSRPLAAPHLHSRSKSESSVNETPPATLLPKRSRTPSNTPKAIDCVDVAVTLQDPPVPSTKLEIIQQLRDISAERIELLQQLNALSLREKELLSKLLDMESLTQSLPTSTLGNEIAVPVSSLRSTEEVNTLQPSNTSRKPTSSKCSFPRPVSAPPKSTPSNSRHRTPSTSKRVPLADKTESSLATFDSTPLYTAECWDTSPVDPRAQTLESTESTPFPPTSPIPPRRGRSVRVPIKFGDEPTTETTSTAGNRPPTPRNRAAASSSCSSTSSSRSAAPGELKDYLVPHTVARKKWKF